MVEWICIYCSWDLLGRSGVRLMDGLRSIYNDDIVSIATQDHISILSYVKSESNKCNFFWLISSSVRSIYAVL